MRQITNCSIKSLMHNKPKPTCSDGRTSISAFIMYEKGKKIICKTQLNTVKRNDSVEKIIAAQ